MTNSYMNINQHSCNINVVLQGLKTAAHIKNKSLGSFG